MKDNKFILVVRVGSAKEHTYTDDSGDYDREYSYQAWSYSLREVEVSKNIRAEIDRYNDGDYDYTSCVLFVLEADTRRILIDYTDTEHTDELKFMSEAEKKAYLEAFLQGKENREQREETALRYIEAGIGELVGADGEVKA